MKIYIDTDTFHAAPALYADAEKTKRLPATIPVVEGWAQELSVGFLGANQPAESATVRLVLAPPGSAVEVARSTDGVRSADASGNALYAVLLSIDTSAMRALLDAARAKTLPLVAGVLVTDADAGTRVEYQFRVSVSESVIGVWETPVSMSELNLALGETRAARDAAQAAREGAETAQSGAVAAQEASESARDAAKASEGASKASEGAAAKSAERASASARDASESASLAGSRANAAETSAESASQSAREAYASAENALQSERSASASAETASDAAASATSAKTTAEQHASNAEASATAAGESATAAQESASAAETSASDASASAEAAQASEAAAGTSAENAAASATESANSASEASSSAASAKTSETNASASAGSAKASETAAGTSATNAASSEASAKDSADSALASKTAAATSETNAAASASSAASDAKTASDSATSASSSASAAKASEDSAAESASTAAAKAEEISASAETIASNSARLDALEAKFSVFGLGWFKPDASVEADATAGRLDDKRRILIGIDKTGKVVQLKHGSFGSDGLWHDTTGVYAGIYVKRWDHEKQEWKTPVPAPHATGKTYSENTLDTMGILPWAGIRDAVLPDEINGVSFEQHVVKIPQFRFAKKYHVTIRWKSEASSTGYVDETGELKIMLAVPPAEVFSIGFDADGTGTGVVTLTPEDFPVHDAFVVPDGSGGTREIDHIGVAKYFGKQLNCGGTQVMTSRPVASRNSAPNRGQATQYCENGNLGTLGASYTEVNSTAAQYQLIVDLMEVEFATRDIQSVNTGACSNNATIGMSYSSAWQHCNAENLDDFERRGLEGVRASGWVDYYGKLKTEYDRASDPEAAETQSTGKEYMTRFNWRGIEGGLFCSMIPFVSDMELMCWASEEIPSSLIGADFAQELVAAGVATEDAETGTLTAVSGGCHIMAIRNPETPLSQIYRGTGSTASDRDNFVANYVATGKYRVVELVAPTVQGGTQYFESIPFGMEWPQKTSSESDGNVHGVDYGWWANASAKMRWLIVGGYCNGNTSLFGLRCVYASVAASGASWAAGSRACFIPNKA